MVHVYSARYYDLAEGVLYQSPKHALQPAPPESPPGQRPRAKTSHVPRASAAATDRIITHLQSCLSGAPYHTHRRCNMSRGLSLSHGLTVSHVTHTGCHTVPYCATHRRATRAKHTRIPRYDNCIHDNFIHIGTYVLFDVLSFHTKRFCSRHAH